VGRQISTGEDIVPTVVLRRRLFGFKAQQVHEMLAQRDVAMSKALERTTSVERELGEARDRLKTAEQTVQEAQERASSAERRKQELEGELASIRAELAQRPAQADPVTALLMQGLAPILETARESAAAMMVEATKLSEQRVGQADDVLRTLRDQARAMASWWEGIQKLVEPMLSTLQQARTRMKEIPARIEQALTPLGDLMGAVEEQLGEIAAASEPPPFRSPLDPQGKILDLTEAREGEGAATTVEGPDREREAGTAVGLRKASHAWWPEVTPSARSSGT
jgi:DNA repair exonuclease SbcCD ATPase subunit